MQSRKLNGTFQMISATTQVPIFDLVAGLSSAMDLVDASLFDHHSRTAYIMRALAAELRLPTAVQHNLMIAAFVHDAGALSTLERTNLMDFEVNDPHTHAEMGYHLFTSFAPLATAATYIRYHHTPWQDRVKAIDAGALIPDEACLLCLADRISVLLTHTGDILEQMPGIVSIIEVHAGKLFAPEHVEAFRSLSSKEYFWFDVTSPRITETLRVFATEYRVDMDEEYLCNLAHIISRIIDFRSPFTATHTRGVAAVAEELARIHHFSVAECRHMRTAGFMHDLGKLAIPTEILEKPGKLTPQEFNLIKRHTFHTYRILAKTRETEQIAEWAAFHHETLTEDGYPFHTPSHRLSLGSRIMTVADIFAALTEDRPYRVGMPVVQAEEVLQKMAQRGTIDGDIVASLMKHSEELDGVRAAAQHDAIADYRRFRNGQLQVQ
jgi:HD-GYP domain-containing protein (c-di-GMP phosphodiesterase class II)